MIKGERSEYSTYVSQEWRKGETVVSGEGPSLARRRRQKAERSADDESDYHRCHYRRAYAGIGGVVEDFDEVVTRGAGQSRL